MEFRAFSPVAENPLVSSLEMRLRSGSDFLQSKIRIIVMGSKGVGKASFVEYFLRQKCVQEYRHRDYDYPEAITKSKIITEFIVIDEALNPTLKKLSFKLAHAFVLLYSVDDQATFDHVCELKDQLCEMKRSNVPILIIGNKNDVLTQQVHPVITDCVVTIDWELPHVVVSLKNGDGMDVAQKTLMDELCKQKVVKYASNEPTYNYDSGTPSTGLSQSRRLSVPIFNTPARQQTGFRERGGSTSRSKWVLIKTFFTGNKK